MIQRPTHPDESMTNPQLTKRLRMALLLTLMAVLVLATIAAAVSAYLESSDIQDEMLLSVSKLIDTNQIGSQKNTDPVNQLNRADRQEHGHDSDNSAVRIWEIGGKYRHGFPIKKSRQTGFHTMHVKDDFWRVFITSGGTYNSRFAVAQKLSVSTELALKSAFNTAIPLLALFLLVPLLITLIVRHSFKPLNRLSRKIENNDSLSLDVSNKAEIPLEVLPFVSAIDSLLEKNMAYNQRQQRFIADAAHELRTPITALSLEIENVQKAPDEASKLKRQASLTKSIHRLQRLVNQLLDLARAQSIDTEVRKTVSLNELVKIQIADLYVLAENKNIEISVDKNDQANVVDINNQLQHLIRNAISNAIKFAPEDGKIKIHITNTKGQANFMVIDNGPGVPEHELQKLHEPFYRPDGQASGKGAGLGLAICHEIAKQLKGQLVLDNAQPSGFHFRYRQPLASESL